MFKSFTEAELRDLLEEALAAIREIAELEPYERDGWPNENPEADAFYEAKDVAQNFLDKWDGME